MMAEAVSRAMASTWPMASVFLAVIVVFGLGETLVEVGLERLALGVALGGQLGAGFLSQGLGAALGLGESLLVGGAGVFGAVISWRPRRRDRWRSSSGGFR